MSKITLNSAEKSQLVHEVKVYFDKELEQDLGQFDAEFLINFFMEKIGPTFYNRGLEDARTIISERFESIQDDLYGIQKS